MKTSPNSIKFKLDKHLSINVPSFRNLPNFAIPAKYYFASLNTWPGWIWSRGVLLETETNSSSSTTKLPKDNILSNNDDQIISDSNLKW